MARLYNVIIFCPHVSKKMLFLPPQNGEMAERSNAAVLKTVEGHTSGGSNPSLSATCRDAPWHVSTFFPNNEKRF